MDEIVTCFSSFKSENVVKERLDKVLYDFKYGTYEDKIIALRNALEQQGEQKYSQMKRRLPAVAFCGEFVGGHSKENLLRYNNLLVFDIDHLSLEEMRKVAAYMENDNFVLAFWISPSGAGFKGLIRINYSNVSGPFDLDTCYKKAYNDVSEYFCKNFGVKIDAACSDYSRLCYVCWDKDLYQNDSPSPFIVDCGELKPSVKRVADKENCKYEGRLIDFKPSNVPGKNSQHDRNLLSSILKYLTKRNLSITYAYDDWLRVGFAIANSFNYDLGVKYFLAFSRLDTSKYNENECIMKLKECYLNGKGQVTLGTIVEMARSKGFKGSSEDL